MGLSIEHCSSNSSRGTGGNCGNRNNNDSPSGEDWINIKDSLLSSVGEAVVSGVHVVEGSGFVHFDGSSVEVWFTIVKLEAVSNSSISVSSITSSVSQQGSVREARVLVNQNEVSSEIGSIKQSRAASRSGIRVL